ncbi:MAG: rhomboid family intramembrane serine protease [bacterium]
MSEPLLCPKCGALIGKHLVRCYQCNTYLMGSRMDSWTTAFLPEKAQKNPATSLLIFLSFIPFLLVFLKIGPASLLSISSYTMTQIGATNSALILMDQYWRFVTANFVHFNALHLLMNMLGLLALGPFIEEMFDYKKCFFIFFISGTFTFAIFTMLTFLLPNIFMSALAGGASAGIFGLLGAGIAGARKMNGKKDLQKILLKNFFQNLVLGLIILPLGSTVLHVLGFGLGFLFAFFIPAGSGALGKERKLFSYSFLFSLIIVVLSFGFQTIELKKYPLLISQESFKSRLSECLSTNPNSVNNDPNSLNLIKEKIKTCEIILRIGVNHPEAIVNRLVYLAQDYPNLLNKEKYTFYLKRMNKLLKPAL